MTIASYFKPQLQCKSGAKSRSERPKQGWFGQKNLGKVGTENVWFLKRLPGALHLGKRNDALRASHEEIKPCTLKFQMKDCKLIYKTFPREEKAFREYPIHTEPPKVVSVGFISQCSAMDIFRGHCSHDPSWQHTLMSPHRANFYRYAECQNYRVIEARFQRKA